MQFDAPSKTKFTIRGEPLVSYSLIREDRIAHLAHISEITSFHLVGLNVGEILTLFQRRGPYMVIRPRAATLH